MISVTHLQLEELYKECTLVKIKIALGQETKYSRLKNLRKKIAHIKTKFRNSVSE